MSNRVAIVTGGTSGIGRATALALKEAGCTVYELSRRAQGVEGLHHIAADVTKEETIRAAVAEIMAREGRIDILVNNAGFGISGAVEFTDTADAKALFDVNFFGMVSMNRVVIPIMREAGHGRIVNLSSVAAPVPIPFQTYYSATKAAVNAYTMALANELRPFGVTVCAVMPGDIHTAYLHGKMKPKEKNEVMQRFIEGTTDILVSTTVIEVGIDVPNATVMMIENAERFGLAQLHQLRGRVGRGSAQSYCIFMAGNSSRETMERLNILGGSNDGFYVAEQDLKLRGPGDLFGIRQSGELNFALADIYQDAGILKDANEAAAMYTKDDILNLCKKYEGLRKRIMAYTDDIFL